MGSVASYVYSNRAAIAGLINSAMVAATLFGLPLTTLQMGGIMTVVNYALVLLAHKAPQP